jgi:hypothetical protein
MPIAQVGQREPRGNKCARAPESGRDRLQQQLERMVFQLAPYLACADLRLHTFQPVKHDQMRAAVAQAALQSLEAASTGRIVRLAEEELRALAHESVGIWLFIERPHQDAASTGWRPALLQ